MGAQAIVRNTKIVTHSECFASAGPCTDMILYEGAAVALSIVSGASLGPETVGRAAKEIAKYTGLESRFYAEVDKACLGLKREDVKALKPKKEWLDIYEKVKKELEDLGIKFS